MITKYFAVSDVHSFYKELTDVLDAGGFEIDNDSHHLIICGDLFDRGDQSIDCFNFVSKLKDMNRLHYVKGNHETLLKICLNDMGRGKYIDRHHVSNGTLGTISQFLGINVYDALMGLYDSKKFVEFYSMINSFIDDTCVDYFEVADYVFVHGWIPTIKSEDGYMAADLDYTSADEHQWERARWENGMELWKLGVKIPDKTIVMGHWHSSYGHAVIHKDGKEWGDDAKFTPFEDNGIIALDACTAYTRCMNCLILDVEDNKVIKKEVIYR